MQIPLVDLSVQDAPFRDALDAAIAGVVAGGAFVKGPAVGEFERAFAAFCGVDHAVGVGNGTDGLRLALQAAGVGPGHEVVTVANTFAATAEAALQLGATVRLVDADRETWMLDATALLGVVSPATGAVVPVHLFGHVVDHGAVERATAQRVPVIEDAAQAHGARYRGRRVGSLGRAAAFSFYPGKNLGAYGDAGAVVTADEGIAERVRQLADHGRDAKHHHAVAGWNSRLDSIQAAVLTVKLAHLDRLTDERRRLAASYRELLGELAEVRFPAFAEGSDPVHHLMVAAVDDRDGLREFLRDEGVETGVHYPVPLHLQSAFRHLGYERGDFPVAEALAERIVSFPLYPGLGLDGVARVTAAVRAFYGQRRRPSSARS